MIKAFIFDMDGVIADSQKVHSQIESDMLARYGIHLSAEEITDQFSGMRVADFFQDLFDQHGITEDVGPIVIEKRQAIVDFVKEHGAEPMPGIFTLVDMLIDNNIALALGTASSLELAGEILKSLGLQDKIVIIASGHEVAKGKPEPDIFLLAAERLGMAPADCVVVEDARAGMQAAKAAKMKCIGLVSDKTADYPADVLVESLEEVDMKMIASL
jgi:beta-phosphoglucomutase family hydrolase